MPLHYLKTAAKGILRHKGFTMLNVTGLTLAITSCILIALYVDFELSFDKFHNNRNNIYRVVMQQPGNLVVGSSSDWWIVSPYILKPTWENEIPQIHRICRTTERNFSFLNNNQSIDEPVLVVDPEFFDIFTFPLIQGNSKKVFNDPYAVVITQKLANKYFGNNDPLGKTFTKNDGKLFHVTGVLADIPENSHLRFDMLIAFNTIEAINGKSLLSDNWLNNGYRTYLTLQNNTSPQDLDAILHKYDVEGFNKQKWSFHLQPLADIHFNKLIKGTGDKNTLFIFVSAGAFILFIAAFNAMNLYIAHYRSRSKNISIRRITGATRLQLLLQFQTESLMLVLISFSIALLLACLMLPVFNNFIGIHLSYKALFKYQALTAGVGIIILTTVIAGLYPALYLSGLQITNGIKGGIEHFSKQATFLRKAVTSIQFAIAIVLIVGTITIYRQLHYIAHKNLGYEKELILYLSLDGIWYKDTDGTWRNRTETLRNELLQNTSIIAAAGSSGIPSQIGWSNIPTWEGQTETDKPFFYRLDVDENFLKLYNINIINGKPFEAGMPYNNNVFILNEAAVKVLQVKDPVGTPFGFENKLGTVVGVAKDFHFESLYTTVTPLAIGLTNSDHFNYLSVKIKATDIPQTIRNIEKTWARLTNNTALKYGFLDDQLAQLYLKDQHLAESMNYFSFMALLITSLGVFGLMAFSVREKTKELGIRKILGAPTLNLLQILSKDILRVIGAAVIIGSLIGWHIAQTWLNNFAYRINVNISTIIFAAITTLLLATLPISFMLLKATRTNPIHTLKTE